MFEESAARFEPRRSGVVKNGLADDDAPDIIHTKSPSQ
jgi:hypothetical protein